MLPTAVLCIDVTLWMYLLSANIQHLFFGMLKIKQVGGWQLLRSIYCHVMRENQSAAVKTLVSVLYFASYECSNLPYRNSLGLVTHNRRSASKVNYKNKLQYMKCALPVNNALYFKQCMTNCGGSDLAVSQPCGLIHPPSCLIYRPARIPAVLYNVGCVVSLVIL